MFEKKDTPYKIILYGLLMLVLYLLQSVPAFGLRFLGNPPELLLALSVSVAFFETETFSAFFGLACGFISDAVTGGSVGGSAIFFMFAAFFTSVLLQTLLRRMFITYIAVLLSLTALFLIIEYIFAVLFLNHPPFLQSLMHAILPKLLFTGVCGYPLYPLTRILHRKTTRRDEF